MRLEGKRVIVTGAAGGLGSAISRGLLAEGAALALLDRASPALTALAHETDSLAIPADVTQEDEVRSAMDSAAKHLGGLDAIVIGAGIQLHGQDGVVAEVSLKVWQRTLDVNLTGAFLCCKYALPLLACENSSSVVLVGSPTGLTMAGAGYSAYSASKAGMMSLGRVIAADYAEHGVRANVVVPGTMETPLIEPLLDDPDTRGALLAGIPIGRLGKPSDLTGLATWLVSDESRYSTGAFFAVDGGITAR